MRLLPTLAVCAALAACDSAPAEPDIDLTNPLGWTATSGTDAEYASVTFGPDGTFAARPVCNSYGGTYEAEGDRIKIEVEGGTRINCGGFGNRAENDFVAALERVSRFEIDGRLLLLDGGALRFEAEPRFRSLVAP